MKDNTNTFNIQLSFKDGTISFQCPRWISLSHVDKMMFPHNCTNHSQTILSVLDQLNYSETNPTYEIDCQNNDQIHSVCVMVEFFSRLGWRIFNYLNCEFTNATKRTGYTISHRKTKELKFNICFVHKSESDLIIAAYDALREPTGYIHPSSILANTIIDVSNPIQTDTALQFFFDYHYKGKNVVDLAFTDLDDPLFVPLHNYLVEEIARGLTKPWSSYKQRENIIKFLTIKPGRLDSFESFMTKLCLSLGCKDNTITKCKNVIRKNFISINFGIVFETDSTTTFQNPNDFFTSIFSFNIEQKKT